MATPQPPRVTPTPQTAGRPATSSFGPTPTSCSGSCTGRSRTRRPPDPSKHPEPGSRSTGGLPLPAPGASQRFGYWSGPRAFRRRGFIEDDCDAIRLRNPDALRRLTSSRACVEDHLRPVTGGTYDSRAGGYVHHSPPERFQRRHRGARRHRQGDGDTAEGSVSGDLGGGRRELGGSGLAAGGAG
jgi:hypothetical protein